MMTSPDAPATLLAFDTSTEAMAVALAGPNGCELWNGPGGAQASAQLLPTIRQLLGRGGLALGDLQALAFGCGPGAFTGLRTACAVVQGLAEGVRRPVIAVDSLMIVAQDAYRQQPHDSEADIGVAMDARMGELYAARYRRNGRAWEVLMSPVLIDPAALVERWAAAPPGVLAGSGVAMLQGFPMAATLLPEARDRAAALLDLARDLWAAGAAIDAACALPVYLRDKVALTTAERQDRAAAAAAAP
jgi:tRNA threonylcarbamoyladenosine biosynthesis protein TsaB